MSGLTKILIISVFVITGYIFLRAAPSKNSKAVAVQTVVPPVQPISVQVVNPSQDPDFIRAQEEFIKAREKDPLVVNKVYDNGRMVSELEAAASEEQRMHDVKVEIIREVNEGEELQVTEEERQMFAEMMAAHGLKSSHSTD